MISDNVADEVAALRDKHSGDILVNGSATLVHALAANNLVDEYRLMVFPTVLGKGKRLFCETPQADSFKLTETLPVGSDGVVVLTYQPVRDAA